MSLLGQNSHQTANNSPVLPDEKTFPLKLCSFLSLTLAPKNSAVARQSYSKYV